MQNGQERWLDQRQTCRLHRYILLWSEQSYFENCVVLNCFTVEACNHTVLLSSRPIIPSLVNFLSHLHFSCILVPFVFFIFIYLYIYIFFYALIPIVFPLHFSGMCLFSPAVLILLSCSSTCLPTTPSIPSLTFLPSHPPIDAFILFYLLFF